ncbi:hypothetical protein VTL71DRAFT_3244 [Oculimacula yallundae]|uniref:Uncharacterized protein n=1 Tax=Oculimacula yallundae TaxID=86028 RepID=A0ABR4C6K3_9HELO
MQIKTLLLFLTFLTTAYFAIITIIPTDPLPCIPSKDASTCLLNYSTNSGAVLDLSSPAEISASAFIYSNTCLQLAHKKVSVPGETSVLSWGLSFKRPLLLGSESRPGISWWMPWFKYDGQRYGYEDCSCAGSAVSGGYKCSCQFRCKLWVID